MRKHRLFIGILVPDEVKRKIKKVQEELEKQKLPLRLVNLENIHITLNFLGYLKDREVVEVSHIIEKVFPNFSVFDVKLSDFRFFPSESRARVVAIMIESNNWLERSQKELQKELKKLAFLKIEKREFKPHLTIARVKGRGIKINKLEQIKNIKIKSTKWTVKEVELIESVLSRSGAKYTVLEKVGLKE